LPIVVCHFVVWDDAMWCSQILHWDTNIPLLFMHWFIHFCI
jgi:hypothetical protein